MVTRHGLSPWSFQIRRTVSSLTPTTAASERVDQCVAPPGGVPVRVSSTTRAVVSGGSHDVRPRPLATFPTPSIPIAANRFRHARTVSGTTPTRRAISSFATH